MAPRPQKERPGTRTTISLDPVVWQWGQEMMKERGFNNNFSTYVADLIRRDKERQEELRAAAQYPAHRPEFSTIEEKSPSLKEAESKAVQAALKYSKKNPPPK